MKIAMVVLCVCAQASAQLCVPGWSAEGAASSLAGDVNELVMFDDGSGPALYAGGAIWSAGGDATAQGVARWTGTKWARLGGGIAMQGIPPNPPGIAVRTMCGFDDGNGPALYVAGRYSIIGGAFVDTIGRWDGSSWANLPGISGFVQALETFDDGSGPALYAGGDFTVQGRAANLAKYRNGEWSAVGTGTSGGGVRALKKFTTVEGTGLYIGGVFTQINGQPIGYLARYDGAGFTSVGGGVSGSASGVGTQVLSMDVSEAGGSPGLYVAGFFSMAGTTVVEKLARWDGAAWSGPPVRQGGSIQVVRGVHDALGPALYAGGNFGPGNLSASSGARWNGAEWSLLGSGVTMTQGTGMMKTFCDLSNAPGQQVIVGGHFDRAGNVAAGNIARWLGSWQPMGLEADATVRAVARFGGQTYVGGDFSAIAGAPQTRGLARKGGGGWSTVGGGMDGQVKCMTVWNDGTGEALYVGGLFVAAGPTLANNIAKWDGAAWSRLGNGIPGQGPGQSWSGVVNAVAVYDDGKGAALYAAGSFLPGLGAPDRCIAKWDGDEWLPVGGGLEWTNGAYSLAVYDNGTGPKLWVGTEYNNAPVPVSIAAWDGTAWSRPVGTPATSVLAMAVYEGTGPRALYFGGLSYGGPLIARVAGASLQTNVGMPFANGGTPAVRALTVVDDGSGKKLIMGGRFDTVSGAGKNVARYDGAAWSAMGTGVNDAVWAAGEGLAGQVVVGGDFLFAGTASSGRLAYWRGACACYANCDGSTGTPLLTANDFLCFMNAFAAGDPAANCDGSTVAPVLTANDFMCFMNEVAEGCM